MFLHYFTANDNNHDFCHRHDDDNVDFDSELKYFLFDIQGAKIPFVVDKWGLHDNKIFVSFHDINTIEKARVYVGKSVYLPISMRPQLAEGEFFMSALPDSLSFGGGFILRLACYLVSVK